MSLVVAEAGESKREMAMQDKQLTDILALPLAGRTSAACYLTSSSFHGTGCAMETLARDLEMFGELYR